VNLNASQFEAGDLPKGWALTIVGQIATFEYGKALKRDKRNSSGKIPVYGSNGVVGYHSEALVTRPSLIIGRKGAIGAVHFSKVPFWPIDTTYFVEPPEGIDLSFLFYLLSRLNLVSLDRSTAIPGLNRDDAYAQQISLPPANEQKRIVAKIEELFTRLDAGVEALKKVKAELKHYRQAVLKYAFEGRLTAEWREKNKDKLEPISKLLERIAKEREKTAKGKAKKLPPLDKSKLPELPDGWEWAMLIDVSAIKGGITKDQKRRFKNGRLVPYLRVANLQRGYLDLSSVKQIHASEEIIDSLSLKQGDVLFTEGGDRDKLGRGCVWNGEVGDCIHQNHIFRARPYSKDLSGKILSWFGNTYGQLWFAKEGKQTTNLASINLTKLSRFPVPIIPCLEQKAFIAEIERHFSIADEVEHTIEKCLKEADRLRQSILKRAFEGKLVPQDPNDEPAEKLLERIKTEKRNYRREWKVKERAGTSKLKALKIDKQGE
jgi:type I restriction enzyme S subunit